MYQFIKANNCARRGVFTTVHGAVQTPAFMNVATAGAIKGGLSAFDLRDNHCQVMLCNTYHLHLRPGDKVVAALGGLHQMTRWDGPILTDSGGFQVFSLSKLRKITEEGVLFQSHLDGHRIFMGPEESMRIQA
ncbi:MAG: tRNA guanosine(34) transglycosylase Tgt, partial [Ruthenibacterium sp.]